MANITLQDAYNRAKDALEAGDHGGAIAIVQYILRTYPRYIEAYRLLGEAYLERGQQDEASRLFSHSLNADPQNVLARIGRAIIAEERGNVDGAIHDMERAFESDPSIGELRSELLRLYTTRYGSAGATIRTTAAGLAYVHLRGGLLDQAIAEFERVLLEHPERWDLEVVLLESLWRNEQLDEAAELASRILSDHPNAIKANWILGYLDWTGGKTDTGSRYLTAALSLDPDYTIARELWAATPWPLDYAITQERPASIPDWERGQLVIQELDQVLPIALSADPTEMGATATAAPAEQVPPPATVAQAPAAVMPEAAPEYETQPEPEASVAPVAPEDAAVEVAQPQAPTAAAEEPALSAGLEGDWFDSWATQAEEQARRSYEEELSRDEIVAPRADQPVAEESVGAIDLGAANAALEPGAVAESVLYGAPADQIGSASSSDDEGLPAWLLADPLSFGTSGAANAEPNTQEQLAAAESGATVDTQDEWAAIAAAAQPDAATTPVAHAEGVGEGTAEDGEGAMSPSYQEDDDEGRQFAFDWERDSSNDYLKPFLSEGSVPAQPEAGADQQPGQFDFGASGGGTADSDLPDWLRGSQNEADPFAEVSEFKFGDSAPAPEWDFGQLGGASSSSDAGAFGFGGNETPSWAMAEQSSANAMPDPFYGPVEPGGDLGPEIDFSSANDNDNFTFGDGQGIDAFLPRVTEDVPPALDMSAEDLPDWLRAPAQPVPAEPPARATTQPQQPAAPAGADDSDLPEWLRGEVMGGAANTGATQAAPVPATPATPEADDWNFSDLGSVQPFNFGAESDLTAPPSWALPMQPSSERTGELAPFADPDDAAPLDYSAFGMPLGFGQVEAEPARPETDFGMAPFDFGATAASTTSSATADVSDSALPPWLQGELGSSSPAVEPFNFGLMSDSGDLPASFDFGDVPQPLSTPAEIPAPALNFRTTALPDLGDSEPFDLGSYLGTDLSGGYTPAAAPASYGGDDIDDFVDFLSSMDDDDAEPVATAVEYADFGTAPFVFDGIDLTPSAVPEPFAAAPAASEYDLGVAPFSFEDLDLTPPPPAPATPSRVPYAMPPSWDEQEDFDFAPFEFDLANAAPTPPAASGASDYDEPSWPDVAPQSDYDSGGYGDMGEISPFSFGDSSGFDAGSLAAAAEAATPSDEVSPMRAFPWARGVEPSRPAAVKEESAGEGSILDKARRRKEERLQTRRLSEDDVAGTTEGAAAMAVPAQPESVDPSSADIWPAFDDDEEVAAPNVAATAPAEPVADAPVAQDFAVVEPFSWTEIETTAATPAAETAAAPDWITLPSVEPFDYGESDISDEVAAAPTQLVDITPFSSFDEAVAERFEAAPIEAQADAGQSLWSLPVDEQAATAAAPAEKTALDTSALNLTAAERAYLLGDAEPETVTASEQTEAGADTSAVEVPAYPEALPFYAETPADPTLQGPAEPADHDYDLASLPVFDLSTLDIGSAGSAREDDQAATAEVPLEDIEPFVFSEEAWPTVQRDPTTYLEPFLGEIEASDQAQASIEPPGFAAGESPWLNVQPAWAESETAAATPQAEGPTDYMDPDTQPAIEPFTFAEPTWADQPAGTDYEVSTPGDWSPAEAIVGESSGETAEVSPAEMAAAAPVAPEAGAGDAVANETWVDSPYTVASGQPGDWYTAEPPTAEAPVWPEATEGPAWLSLDPATEGAAATSPDWGHADEPAAETPVWNSPLEVPDWSPADEAAQVAQAEAPGAEQTWPETAGEFSWSAIDQASGWPPVQEAPAERPAAATPAAPEPPSWLQIESESTPSGADWGQSEDFSTAANTDVLGWPPPTETPAWAQPEVPAATDEPSLPDWLQLDGDPNWVGDTSQLQWNPNFDAQTAAEAAPDLSAVVPATPTEWPHADAETRTNVAPDWHIADTMGATPDQSGENTDGEAPTEVSASPALPLEAPVVPDIVWPEALVAPEPVLPVAPDWQMQDAGQSDKMSEGAAEYADIAPAHVPAMPAQRPSPNESEQTQAPAAVPATPDGDPLESLRQMVDASPKDQGSRLALAVGYVQHVDYDRAAAQFRILLKDRTLSSDVLQMVAENLQEIIETQPGHAASHRLLGDVYMRQGQFQAAINQYNWLLTSR